MIRLIKKTKKMWVFFRQENHCYLLFRVDRIVDKHPRNVFDPVYLLTENLVNILLVENSSNEPDGQS